MTELQPTHGWRFSLRTLLILTVVAALAAFNWKFFFYLGVAAQKDLIFWFVALVFGAIAWNFGQTAPRGLSSRGSFGRNLAILFLMLSVMCALYLLWVRMRWQMLTWTTRPRFYFPYPDRWLAELHDWFDRRYSAGNYIKFRGEVDRVYIVVNYSAWLVTTTIAFFIGLLFRVDRRLILRHTGSAIAQYWRSINNR